eukprot:10503945-Ditylum_brightwellii.AAC.1
MRMLLPANSVKDTAAMIGNKNEMKSVLLGLKYDQAIKDNATHHSNLLHEQNAYLKNYADLKVGRLTEEALGM